MSRAKLALLACAAMLSLTASAAAQGLEPWDIKDRMAITITPDGKAKLVQMNDAGHAMMMKNGKAMGSRMIIYRSGGKFYLMEDRRMKDGTMMFDRIGDWMTRGPGT
jgi:hypothetical protein